MRRGVEAPVLVPGRLELNGRTLILSADHPDKAASSTRTFAVEVATLPEVLVGQVVWVGRTLPRP